MTTDANRASNSGIGFTHAWLVKLGKRNQSMVRSGRLHILVLLAAALSISIVSAVALLFFPNRLIATFLSEYAMWLHVVLTIIIACLAYLIWGVLLEPILRLCRWADLMRGINLNTTVHFNRHSDFLELQDDINMLGNMIDQLSRDTEVQLQKHTDHISQKTRSLTILYDIASTISASSDLNSVFGHTLDSLCRNLSANSGYIKRTEETKSGSSSIAKQYGEIDDNHTAFVEAASANKQNVQVFENFPHTDGSTAWIVSIPIRYRMVNNGWIFLCFDADQMIILDDYDSLLNSIGQHLGTAIEKYRLHEEENQLLVVRERTRLSHELHDSLAQTLASLRIQARLLDDSIQTTQDKSVWSQRERIEYTVEEANNELRALIAHFRIPAEQNDFLSSIESTIDNLKSDTNVEIFYQDEWKNANLPSVIENHVLRIIQECFANIRKHSKATRVRLILRSARSGGHHHVFIEDDGIGFVDQPQTRNDTTHFGLSILHDRSHEIGGEINIESEPGEGTQITLSFVYPSKSE